MTFLNLSSFFCATRARSRRCRARNSRKRGDDREGADEVGETKDAIVTLIQSLQQTHNVLPGAMKEHVMRRTVKIALQTLAASVGIHQRHRHRLLHRHGHFGCRYLVQCATQASIGQKAQPSTQTRGV